MLQAQLAAAAVHQEKQQMLQQACDVKVSVARPPHSRQPLTGPHLGYHCALRPAFASYTVARDTTRLRKYIHIPQGHGVFAVHGKFGTFQVPDEFLVRVAPAAVAPKQAVRQVRQASICVGFTPWGPI